MTKSVTYGICYRCGKLSRPYWNKVRMFVGMEQVETLRPICPQCEKKCLVESDK